MFTAYLFVKLVHVLSAIVGVGLAASFPFIMGRAVATPGSTPFALETIAAMSKVTTWAFTAAIVTGLGMGHLGALSFSTLWYSGSLVIAVVAMGLAGAVAQPTLKRQLAIVGQGPAAVPELQRLGMKSRRVGMVLHLCSLVLIALMIFKPTL